MAIRVDVYARDATEARHLIFTVKRPRLEIEQPDCSAAMAVEILRFVHHRESRVTGYLAHCSCTAVVPVQLSSNLTAMSVYVLSR